MAALERRATGLTGAAVAYATRVELVRKGPLAHLGDRVPERTVVRYESLRAVLFEPAGEVSTGYVRFLREGDSPRVGDGGLTEMVERARAADTVLFSHYQQDAFADLRDDVRRRLLDRPREPEQQRLRRRVLDGDLTERRYRRALLSRTRNGG